MKLKTKEEVVEYINSLNDYRGYVQFSHRAIDKNRDIFVDKNPDIKNEDGFIYEAHFCNSNNSLMIRQINSSWLVSQTDISKVSTVDMQNYLSDIEEFVYNIKMAQIWEEESDELCENMSVKKLKKVVLAGFTKGESK